MARLEITTGEPREGPHRGGNAEIRLDGEPIEDVLGRVTSLELRVACGEVIAATISFYPDGIEVDAGVVERLVAGLDASRVEPEALRDALERAAHRSPVR